MDGEMFGLRFRSLVPEGELYREWTWPAAGQSGGPFVADRVMFAPVPGGDLWDFVHRARSLNDA